MNKVKTHSILVRGIDKETKNRLKKKAVKSRRSVNSEILIAVNSYLLNSALTETA